LLLAETAAVARRSDAFRRLELLDHAGARRWLRATSSAAFAGLVRRHGGDADEPLVHPMFVVTIDGVKTADRSSSCLPDAVAFLALQAVGQSGAGAL